MNINNDLSSSQINQLIDSIQQNNYNNEILPMNLGDNMFVFDILETNYGRCFLHCYIMIHKFQYQNLLIPFHMIIIKMNYRK